MSDTRGLLTRISGLRQRLDEAHGPLDAARPGPVSDLAEKLEADVTSGTRVQVLLDGSLRQIAGLLSGEDSVRPTQLTARAKRLLERGRDIVGRLRQLADDPVVASHDTDEPLAQGVRRASAMAESALRLVQAFPDAPSAQLRLSEGLDGLLDACDSRIGALAAAASRRRRDAGQVDALAHLLASLRAGHAMTLDPFTALAEDVLTDARQGEELRFVAGSDVVARVAAHGVNTARILARLVRYHPEYARYPVTPVIAGLLHDVGMIGIPVAALFSPHPLDDDDRRAVEAHARDGAELVTKQVSGAGEIAEAIASHHERLDGTGYPSGRGDLSTLAKLLAVADVYAAQVCDRPYRGALDPRTALTDTLMMAERGELDRAAAGLLLHLGFHPVGSIVELSDGCVARVVAAHSPAADLHAPARPVVTILIDGRGKVLASPITVDLLASEGRTVVRTQPAAEWRKRIGDLSCR
ncbi:MAG: HD domain-containing protein [Gemmataceae bacterium]